MEKKSVVIYFDQYEIIKQLPEKERCLFFDAIFQYAEKNVVITLPNDMEMAFAFIKGQIDRDNEKYASKCKKSRDAINQRWHNNTNDTNVYQRIRTNETNTNDTYTDTDTDTDTDTKRKVEKKDELSFDQRQKYFKDSLVPYVELYGKPMIRAFYDYWSEPNQAKTKMKYELNKTWLLESRLRTWERRAKDGK